MDNAAYAKLTAFAEKPEALEQTVQYLMEHLSTFAKIQERVLICFPDDGLASLGGLFKEAVLRIGGIPIFWGGDRRWKTLLRTAFSDKPTTIVGEPLVLLGLTKLARSTGTPLSIHNVVVSGYPSAPWLVDGLQEWLDCSVWGCYAPGSGPLVVGFGCPLSCMVHLRDTVYSVKIINREGMEVPAGTIGEIALSLVEQPDILWHTKEQASLILEPCTCGCVAPRLTNFDFGRHIDPQLLHLRENLLPWLSVLDYRAKRTESGLELELVAFPGELLPKLPTCAKLQIRPWDPEADEPFPISLEGRLAEFSGESH